jgi:dipeptide transport system permease protein
MNQHPIKPHFTSSPSSLLGEFWQGFSRNRGALIATLFFLILVCCAIFAPFLTLHSPIEQHREYMLVPPAWETTGMQQFLLGTDEVGRDIIARLIYGTRLSLQIGFISVLMSMLPGTGLGLMAAFFPAMDKVIMRLIDIMMALPSLLLAVAIVAVIGPGLTNTMLAIAIVSLPGYVRIVRACAQSEIARDYVMASRTAGASTLRLMFITVLPNCTAPLIVHATLGFSSAILDAAALGFLGLGVQPPLAEWGTMLSSARDYIESAWWVVTMPGLAILLTVLSINLMGDGLRDALDPKLKQI